MTRLVTELLSPSPDRAGDDSDVGGEHLRIDGRPLVAGPAVLGHVGPYAGGDVVVDGAEHVHRHAVLLHDRAADLDEAPGLGHLG
jgi:hypothetical protein